MADITANARVLYRNGTAQKVVIYQVHTVDTSDTISCATEFSKVQAAVSIGASAVPAGDVCAVAGTTVTLDVAAATDDLLFVMVVGASD